MTRQRAARLGLAALVFTGTALGLAACAGNGDVAVLDTALVTWPSAASATAGQVIVSVRNDADVPIDPDVLGNDRLTLAQLRGPGGEELTGGDARVQLHAVPHVLGPGEAGYLIGDFEIELPAERIVDARVEINARPADARTEVSVEGFQVVELADGLGGTGRLEWDGQGTAVVRAVALDSDGRILGYVATSEVRYDPGDFTMCCFPPTVDQASIDDVVVFGDQAIAED